ncbi:hypothetical protein GGR57DRAFT_154312 [Xylariaceae sp. FL1272]|nr:hypothetical protein GGR57DRAFT_154312 [Xylariaceae sp. FL1272]
MNDYGIQNYEGRNLCSDLCPVEHIGFTQGLKLKRTKLGFPDLSGLHYLNYTRNGWLNRTAVEYALQGYYDGLPPEVQDMVDVQAPDISEIFAGGRTGAKALERILMSSKVAQMYVGSVKTKEYSIWPINVHLGHWVLVVLHKEQRRNPKEKKVEWSQIVQMAIIDPARNHSYHRTVESQLRRLLERGLGCGFADGYERKVWTPFQHDKTSCGPRAYQAGKTIMDFIQELHEKGIGYNECLWSDHSGWFNEDFVRSEMMGRNAWRIVKDYNYNARIAVEIVHRVKPPVASKQDNAWVNAAIVMRPTDKTGLKPETRPVDTKEPEIADFYMEPNQHRVQARPQVKEIIQVAEEEPSQPDIKYPIWPLGEWDAKRPLDVPRKALRNMYNPPDNQERPQEHSLGINILTGAPLDTVEIPIPGVLVSPGKRPLFPPEGKNGKRAKHS